MQQQVINTNFHHHCSPSPLAFLVCQGACVYNPLLNAAGTPGKERVAFPTILYSRTLLSLHAFHASSGRIGHPMRGKCPATSVHLLIANYQLLSDIYISLKNKSRGRRALFSREHLFELFIDIIFECQYLRLQFRMHLHDNTINVYPLGSSKMFES